MREAWLRLLLILLLAGMCIYHWVFWLPVTAAATWMKKQLEALELSVLIAGLDRRTRKERETQ